MRKKAVSFVLFILVVGVSLISHEGGHFMAAKLQGIGVKEMSIGVGPTLLSWNDGQTNYTLRLLPLGGYADLVRGKDNSQSYDLAPRRAKALVLAAGAAMNLLVGLIFFTIYSLYELGAVKKCSKTIAVIASLITGLITPFIILYKVIKEPGQMGGVVSILKTTDDLTDTAIKTRRWRSLAGFVGLLNLGLVTLNLLPIPTLDGGRLMFLAIEKATGQSQMAWEQTANLIGGIFILGLVVFLNLRDVFSPAKSNKEEGKSEE